MILRTAARPWLKAMKLCKLAPSQKVKGRWLLFLEDNTILRVSEAEVVAFSLYSGMELDEETRTRLDASARKSAVKNQALNLISARSLSRKELLKKLVEKDAPPDEAEAVADWLEDLGYLNDGEYGKSIVRHYSAKGYGERKLRDELYRRGIPRDLWDESLTEAVASEDGVDTFLCQKLKGARPDQKELKRVSDALSRRGYRWNEISEGIRRYCDGLEDGE